MPDARHTSDTLSAVGQQPLAKPLPGRAPVTVSVIQLSVITLVTSQGPEEPPPPEAVVLERDDGVAAELPLDAAVAPPGIVATPTLTDTPEGEEHSVFGVQVEVWRGGSDWIRGKT